MKRYKNILGYSVLGLGVAGLVVGVSPVFPVFLEAFLVGGVLIGTGLWILAGPELRALVRKALRLKVSSRRRTTPRTFIDPLLPVRILRLARDFKGKLTVAEVAIGLNVPLDQAEAGLSECIRAGNATPDYDVGRGHVIYRFPEFIESDGEHAGSSR